MRGRHLLSRNNEGGRFVLAAWLGLALIGVSGCADSNPAKPGTDPATADIYLQGQTTEDSRRVDELRGSDPQRPPRVVRLMPGALVAESRGLTVTAAMFRHDEYVTLDLIARNLGEQSVELDRKRIELIDGEGHVLQPVADWTGAAEHGLRATRGGNDDQWGVDDLALEEALESSPAGGGTTGEQALKRGVTELDEGIGSSTPADESPHAPREGRRLTAAKEAAGEADVEQVLEVEPDQSRPFWAYWTTASHPLRTPVTAVVKLKDRQMVFRFGD